MKRFYSFFFAVLALSTIALVGCPGKNSPTSTGGSSSPTGTPTVTFTFTWTSTPCFNGLGTPCNTFTFTPTATRTLTPYCTSSYSFGRNYAPPSGGATASLSDGTVFSRFTLPVTAIVSQLHAYVTQPYGSLSLGIYSNNGSAPGTLISSSGSGTAVSGWNSFVIPATSLLPKGTYWIALGTSSGGSLYFASDTSDPTDGYSQSSVVLPSTFSGTGPNSQGYYFYADYCVPAGYPTPVPSPTLTVTATFTVTPTATPTQTAACAVNYSFGRNFQAATTREIDNGSFACYFTLPVAGIVSELHAYVVTTNGAGIEMGLYSNSGSAPGTLITSSGSQPAVAGWNNLAVPASPLLQAGTYWIAVANPGSAPGPAISDYDAGSGASPTDGYASSGLPSTYSGSGPSQYSLSLYADYCVPGTSPTPGKSPTLTFTTTFTVTPTETPTQTLSCAVNYSFGRNYVPSAGVSTWGLGDGTEFSKFTIPADGIVSGLHSYVVTAYGSLSMGIYSNSGSGPGTLISSSASQSAVTGWNNFGIPQTPLLSANSTYWIAAGTSSGGNLVFSIDTANPTDGYTQSFSVLPSSFSGSGPNGQSYYFYADYCVPGTSPTPGKSPTLTFTPTFTVTPTFTTTPTPFCSGPTPVGEINPQTNGQFNYFHSSAVTVGGSGGKIDALNLYAPAAGVTYWMAVYADNGGGASSQPSTLLVQSAGFVAVSGWNKISPLAAVTISAGKYWVAEVCNGNDYYLSWNGGGGAVTTLGYSSGNLSNGPFPTGAVPSGGNLNGEIISMFVDICP